MAGELISAWPNTRQDIWDELATAEGAPDDLYCELLRSASAWLRKPDDPEELNLWQAALLEAFASPTLSKDVFNRLNASDFNGEKALCAFLEDASDTLQELSGEELASLYFVCLSKFIDKFNLRYELLPSCKLMPSIPGVFEGLIDELRRQSNSDEHISSLLAEFENAVRDLKIEHSEARIKTCIQKQVNLLEGIAQKSPLVTKGDLASMCGQLKSWPHLGIKSSAACLYSFASDYPGIRHGGQPNNVLRAIELRDFISMTILLTGFLPYLSDEIDPEAVLWKS